MRHKESLVAHRKEVPVEAVNGDVTNLVRFHLPADSPGNSPGESSAGSTCVINSRPAFRCGSRSIPSDVARAWRLSTRSSKVKNWLARRAARRRRRTAWPPKTCPCRPGPAEACCCPTAARRRSRHQWRAGRCSTRCDGVRRGTG